MRATPPILASLFGLLTTLTACSSDDDALVTTEERKQFVAMDCKHPLAGLSSLLGVDGVQLTSISRTTEKPQTVLVDVDGVPCADKPFGDCLAALAATPVCEGADALFLPDPPGFFPGRTCDLVVTTEGDTATSIRDTRALLAAIGPIDSPAKVSLWLRHLDSQAMCGSVRPVDGGYEVLVEGYMVDCGITEDRLYVVARDGAISAPKKANNSGGTPCNY